MSACACAGVCQREPKALNKEVQIHHSLKSVCFIAANPKNLCLYKTSGLVTTYVRTLNNSTYDWPSHSPQGCHQYIRAEQSQFYNTRLHHLQRFSWHLRTARQTGANLDEVQRVSALQAPSGCQHLPSCCRSTKAPVHKTFENFSFDVRPAPAHWPLPVVGDVVDAGWESGCRSRELRVRIPKYRQCAVEHYLDQTLSNRNHIRTRHRN